MSDQKDSDETRRLLYMALLAPRTKRYNLAGTLVNALMHHRHSTELNADEVADHITGYLEDPRNQEVGRDGSIIRSEEWIREQIDLITTELGD